MGIENIIIITDDPIGKKAHIQAHFERAYLIFTCILLHLFPVIMILMQKQIIYGIIDPVIMAVRIGTGSGITLRFFHKAYLFFRGQNNRLKPQLPFPEQLEGIIRHRPRDGLRSQIKNPFRLSFPYGLNSGKYGGERFTYSGRGFNEQLALMDNTSIYIGSQFLLPFSVRERKSKLPNGSSPLLLPFVSKISPFFILRQQGLKPFIQLRPLIGVHKIPQFLCFHIAVGHSHLHLRAVMFSGIHTCIAFSLGQMDIHWLLHFFQIPVSSLYFIYGNNISIDNSIGPAFHHQIVSGCAPAVAHHHLRLIIRAHSSLYHAVDPPSLRHRVIRRRTLTVVYTAAAQDKFHQAAHGYSYFHVTIPPTCFAEQNASPLTSRGIFLLFKKGVCCADFFSIFRQIHTQKLPIKIVHTSLQGVKLYIEVQ